MHDLSLFSTAASRPRMGAPLGGAVRGRSVPFFH